MSCLFKSLAVGLGQHPERLRMIIAKYLETNPKLLDDINAADIIRWSENKSLAEYSRRMAQPGVAWGGAIEIKAFCDLFKVNVKIHVMYTGKIFEMCCNGTATHTIHITYNGSHFEPYYIEINYHDQSH